MEHTVLQRLAVIIIIIVVVIIINLLGRHSTGVQQRLPNTT